MTPFWLIFIAFASHKTRINIEFTIWETVNFLMSTSYLMLIYKPGSSELDRSTSPEQKVFLAF